MSIATMKCRNRCVSRSFIYGRIHWEVRKNITTSIGHKGVRSPLESALIDTMSKEGLLEQGQLFHHDKSST